MLRKQATKGEQKKQGRNERIAMGMVARLQYIFTRARGGHQKWQNKEGGKKKKITKKTEMVYGIGSLSFPQGFTPTPTLVD